MCVRPSEPTLAGRAVQTAETSEAPDERRRSKRRLRCDGEECARESLRATGRMSQCGRRGAGVVSEKRKAERLMSGPGSSSSVALGDSWPQLGPSFSSAGSSPWLAQPPGSGSSHIVSQNYIFFYAAAQAFI